MRGELHRRVLATIERYGMLRPGDRVGVAVSGGADSVALLGLLEELREALGITLLVLHLNHGLRGADSEADARFVEELSRARGLECILRREDVADKARRRGWNLEDAGRRARQDFFNEVIASGKASRVALAHTADDQAETVLARLIRGTGPTGLAGIYPVAGNVVRPLLEVRRKELRDYLEAAGQAWREDTSNLDLSRLRSRIRLRLLPLLEREFPPGVVEHLASLARLVRSEEEFWRGLEDEVFRSRVKALDGGLAIRVSDISLPWAPGRTPAGSPSSENENADQAAALQALRRRIVRRLVEAVTGQNPQLTLRHVDHVLDLALSGSRGRRLDLPGGVWAEKSMDFQLVVRRRSSETTAAAPSYEYRVELPERGIVDVSIPEIHRRLCLKVIDWPASESDTNPESPALDRELLRPPLVFRNWRPGDSYRPRGRREEHKLKRLFLDRRMEARVRRSWPVLTSAGRLAWVRGMPAAAEFSAREGTRRALLIEEVEDA